MDNNLGEYVKESSESDSSNSSQFVPATPTQKLAKEKTPKYLRNASIKFLTHPVDQNFAWSFFWSIIFAAISVLTGFPTVLALMWILIVAMGLRILLAKCCAPRLCSRGPIDVEAQQQTSCLRAEDFVHPPESLWLHDSSFNLHISQCLFYLDGGFECSKLKEIVSARILDKTTESGHRAFPRFVQKIVSTCSGYCWTEDDEFNLDNHIYDEKKAIHSNEDLHDYINGLMGHPLPRSRSLWEIRLIRGFGRNKDTVLVFRVHQAVSDAMALVAILIDYLSDNRQSTRLKTRFGSATYLLNLFRAMFVAPLTFLGWLVCRRHDYNFFNRRHRPQEKAVAWSRVLSFSRVLRIKQVMRCTMNDVFVAATSGAVRAYFMKHGIRNPPNVTLNLPVDLRSESESPPRMGSRLSQVSLRLPCNTEGAVPRLWEVRRRTEEMKASPDTAVMYGAVYCLLSILPQCVAHWIIDSVIGKATVSLSNVPGPPDPLCIGGRPLRRLVFLSPPLPDIPVAFSVISYAGGVQVAVAADKGVVTRPHLLVEEFETELRRLSHLLARRRIPGEYRRRSHFSDERRQAEIINPPNGELQQKLYAVQEEIHHVSIHLSNLLGNRDPSRISSKGPESRLLHRLEELKEEFSELIRELRRRKSLAEGIVIDTQDEDIDGELRRPRRLILTATGRRASMLASTARPLATPTIPHHGFVVSTPNLQVTDSSPSAAPQTGFLQVAQERSGRRKSDFN